MITFTFVLFPSLCMVRGKNYSEDKTLPQLRFRPFCHFEKLVLQFCTVHLLACIFTCESIHGYCCFCHKLYFQVSLFMSLLNRRSTISIPLALELSPFLKKERSMTFAFNSVTFFWGAMCISTIFF